MSATLRARGQRGRVRSVLVGVIVVGLAATVLSLLGIATATSATAAVPHCPPDCGDVAAGDPLMVPFMTPNPGVDWQAFPAADSQSYVDSLRKNLNRLASGSTNTNVAAARWEWINQQDSLLITLVSSNSLAKVHLQHTLGDAADACSSAGGTPAGSPAPIPGIPGSASGACQFRSGSAIKSARVAAFIRGNVAVLVEIESRQSTALSTQATAQPALQQYAALPSEGVPISSGGIDVGWVLLWLCLLVALAYAIVTCARRRGGWKGPLAAIAESFGRRRVALGVSVLAVVGAMAFSMVESTVVRGFGEWFGVATFGDFWQNWADAAHVTYAGGYEHLYVLDRTLETAPALQVVTAPIARLAFGLSFPYPSAVLYPTAYWVAGPLYLGCMALPICAADRWLSGMGITDIRRRLTVLGVMAITLPPIPLSGHPEDLIALGAMLYGTAAAFDDRPRATGWWLGVALAFQPFAFLAIPIAFIFLKRAQWRTALIPIVAVPLVFLIVPVVAAPSVTVAQLLHQKVYDVFGYISPTWNFDPGVAAFIRGGVAIAAIPAAIVLARFLPKSRRQGAALVVWTMAMLFALRALEPELFPYFLAPTLALAPVSAARLPWWRLGAISVLTIWLTWWLHVAIKAEWSLWLILVFQLLLLGWLAFPGRPARDPDLRETTAQPWVREESDRVLVKR